MASNIRTSIWRIQAFSKCISRSLSRTSVVFNMPEPAEKPLSIPQPDGQPKVYSAKLENIYQSISQLNLLEVADLNNMLKTRLNLPDAPVMSIGALPAGAGASAGAAPSAEEEVPESVQTSFTVKMMSFDQNKKIALIKELKTLLPDMNLVQAKKFIESCPAVVLQDVGKDEAEKMKEALVQVGAEIVIS